MNTPFYVYIHVCTSNHWKEVLNKIYELIKTTSTLYDEIDEIRVVVLGEYNDNDLPHFFNDEKVNVIYTNSNKLLFEKITLNLLLQDSQTQVFRALYLHTKTIRHNKDNPFVNDWLDYLLHFCIEQYKFMLFKLMQNDTCGVNLQQYENKWHYSGNFFYANSNYIRTLKTIPNDADYLAPEMFICSGLGKFVSIHKSGVNHYTERYEREKYNNIFHIDLVNTLPKISTLEITDDV